MVTVQQRNPRTTYLNELKNGEVYDYVLNRIESQNKTIGLEMKRVGTSVEAQMYVDLDGSRSYQIAPNAPLLLLILEDVNSTIYKACTALASISPQEVEQANLNWSQLFQGKPFLFDVGYFLLIYHMLYISVRYDETSLNTLHEIIPWVSVVDLRITH